jgi:hypothetical protein
MMAGNMHVDDAIDVKNGFNRQAHSILTRQFSSSGTQPTDNCFYFEIRQRQRP